MALHVKLLDLNNEFLLGSHMPNRIARSVIPQHLHLHFASEGSFIQVGGLHADSPDDLVRAPFFAGTTACCPAGGAVVAQATMKSLWKLSGRTVLVSAHDEKLTARHVSSKYMLESTALFFQLGARNSLQGLPLPQR